MSPRAQKLALLGAALVALAVVVFVLSRMSSPDAEPERTSAQQHVERKRDQPRRARPVLPDEDSTGDRQRVARHTAMGAAAEKLADPPPPPGEQRDGGAGRVRRFTVQPMLTYALRKQVQRHVDACVRRHAAHRGTRPVVQVVAEVAIVDGILSVTRATVSLSEISGAPGAGNSRLADCVRDHAQKVRLPAKDHIDVGGHTLTLPFAVRD